MTATVALMRHGGSHLIRPIIAALQELGSGRPLDEVLRLMAADLLTGEIIEPGNFGAPLDQAQGPVIVFLRDPRDRMVATRRWWLHKPRKAASMAAGGATADAQIAWLLTEGAFLPEMLRWARIWCAWSGALTVRFEDLRHEGLADISRISAHLGLSPDQHRAAALYRQVYGQGRTYTGRHSDWRETFGPLSNAAWASHGGPELLELMDYA